MAAVVRSPRVPCAPSLSKDLATSQFRDRPHVATVQNWRDDIPPVDAFEMTDSLAIEIGDDYVATDRIVASPSRPNNFFSLRV